MLRRLITTAGLLLAPLVALSHAAHAQAGPIVSVAFGSLDENGGNWRDTKHQTFDMFAGVRTRYEMPVGLVIAGYAGASNRLFGKEDKTCVTATGAPCLPPFPQFKYLGLAVGGEARSRLFGVVLAGGPGIFTSARTKIATPVAGGAFQVTEQGSGGRLGWMGRMDATVFLDETFGIFAAVSTRVIPKFADENLSLTGLSVGVRVR